MKKLFVIVQIVLLLILNNNLSAQDRKLEAIQLGLRIAPNISWLKPNTQDYNSDGGLLKFSWGFVFDYKFTNSYSFSSGFNLNSCGGKLSFPYLDANTTNGKGSMSETYNLRYLELPFSLKMRTRQFGYLTYYGQIGLSAGILVSASADEQFLPDNSIVTLITNNANVKGQFNDFLLSFIFAAGVEYSLGGRTALTGELRFNNGLTNILDFNNNIYPNNPAHAIPNSFEVAVGIMF